VKAVARRRGDGFSSAPALSPATAVRGEAGISLIEVLVAAVIAIIVVVGLAHTFGLGRSFIDRFEVARVALAHASGRLDQLAVLSPTSADLDVGIHPDTPLAFRFHDTDVGTESWRVEWYDDPATHDIHADLKQVTVSVAWRVGMDRDSVLLTRLLPTH
jgi:type II secretory pathway pseudopilin PulG